MSVLAGGAATQEPTAPSKVFLADLSGATTLAAILASGVAVGALVFFTSWAAPFLAPILLGLILTAIATPLFTSFVQRGRSAGTAMARKALRCCLLRMVGFRVSWCAR